MFKQKNSKLVLVLTAFLMFSTALTGCARIKAPHSKLDYSTYSPEGALTFEGKYIIGVRDTLEIFIWRCPELDSTVMVRPEDGKISMPLIGDVRAVGLTPEELAKSVSGKMAYYVKDPKVAVGIKKIGDKKVFVLGEVASPGTYELGRSDRIIDVVGKARGFRESASISTTYIVRGDYHNPEVVRVNLARLIENGDISQNVLLEEGDIVYIPRGEIDNLNYVLRKLFPSLYFSERLATLNRNVKAGSYYWPSDMSLKGDGGGYQGQ